MKNKFNFLITLSFMIYFIILIGERLFSIIASLVNDGISAMFSSFFSGYVYIVAFISIVAFVVYSAIFLGDSCKSMFHPEVEADYKKLSIASGIILVSGMVHTEHTISGIQFAAYGVLIVGLLLKFILVMKEKEEKLIPLMTFFYLVAFSMAIPVVYHAITLPATQTAIFYFVEMVGSLFLVASFTCMELCLFSGKDDAILNPLFLIVMVVIDVPTIALKWSEEINFFVLGAAGIALVLWIVTLVLNKFVIKRAPEKKAPEVKIQDK